MSFRFPVRETIYQSDDSTSSAAASDICTFAIPSGFLTNKDVIAISMEIRSMVNGTTSLSIKNTSAGTDISILPGITGGIVANEVYTYQCHIYFDLNDTANKTLIAEGVQQDSGSLTLKNTILLTGYLAALTAGFTIGVHQGGVGAGGTLKVRLLAEVIRGSI